MVACALADFLESEIQKRQCKFVPIGRVSFPCDDRKKYLGKQKKNWLVLECEVDWKIVVLDEIIAMTEDNDLTLVGVDFDAPDIGPRSDVVKVGLKMTEGVIGDI